MPTARLLCMKAMIPFCTLVLILFGFTGAAGAIEFIVCCLSVEKKIIPPTINYENPDPECDLDYTPNKAKEVDLKFAISNSLGFGGHNATLAVKEFK